MNIAILGGSFDPPHLGHLYIASQVKELLNMDQVWFMPAFQHPFQKALTPVEGRVAMTKLLEDTSIKVSSFEIEQNHSSFTIDTLNSLSAKYPQDTFYWITGSDQLDSFQKYKDWQKIISSHNLIIFPREWILPKFEEKVKQSLQLQEIPKNVILLQDEDLILTNISSTKIRDRVKKGLSIHKYVPDGVEEYIQKHNLYK